VVIFDWLNNWRKFYFPPSFLRFSYFLRFGFLPSFPSCLSFVRCFPSFHPSYLVTLPLSFFRPSFLISYPSFLLSYPSFLLSAPTFSPSAVSCLDGVQGAGETDVDCGGPCPGCLVGAHCAVHDDCRHGPCLHVDDVSSVCGTFEPTASPTAAPTVSPTPSPSTSPTKSPTAVPSVVPTPSPSARPSSSPTLRPTEVPTRTPTAGPTPTITAAPTMSPTPIPCASSYSQCGGDEWAGIDLCCGALVCTMKTGNYHQCEPLPITNAPTAAHATGSCGFLGDTGQNGVYECMDGSTTTSHLGCKDSGGGIAVCPKDQPYMCANTNSCAYYQDYCCKKKSTDCSSIGGLRQCELTDSQSPAPTVAEGSCADGLLNGEEVAVDCGGTLCQGCAVGQPCVLDGDCAGEVCTSNVCVIVSPTVVPTPMPTLNPAPSLLPPPILELPILLAEVNTHTQQQTHVCI
jgi:hypothetical protein